MQVAAFGRRETFAQLAVRGTITTMVRTGRSEQNCSNGKGNLRFVCRGLAEDLPAYSGGGRSLFLDECAALLGLFEQPGRN
jgi:hypothetical protein